MSVIKVNDLLSEIKSNLKQKNASQKDEIRVMQSMLNDDSFKVDVYDRTGKIAEYSPAEEYKGMVANILSSGAKLSKEEAKSLASTYEASKSDATAMIGISKQFVNTYLETGRKLPLGGRETTNFALCARDIDEKTKPCPKKVGVNDDGSAIYETTYKTIPAHIGLKATSSCPTWVIK